MARRRSERRYSIWTFVAPVVLVVAVLVVVNVASPLTDRGDDAPASTSTTSTSTSTGAGTGQGAATTGAGTGAAQPTVYTVKADDTLSGIALQFGTTAARLQALNPGLQANALQIGQRIRVA